MPQSCCSVVFRLPYLTLVILTGLLVTPAVTAANEIDQDVPVSAVGGAVHADLFTGTATTSIPIAVPPGRGGVQPNLALVYNSANGNGWVGLGWKLEKSVIERQTRFGLNYAGDAYVFRLAGINVDLVNIGNNHYTRQSVAYSRSLFLVFWEYEEEFGARFAPRTFGEKK